MRLPNYTSSPWQDTYSEIIDVRSENEFAEDHLPYAINLPVLNDEQRAQVGTIYKQVSAFEARKIGAAIVSQNISNYLQKHFASKDKNYSPLIYCWRGGQRSSSLALILSQIGWQVTVLTGGYKTYRAYVRQQLSDLPQKFKYKVLCGLTGTGKTYLLHQLEQQGLQILDLEALAQHRGSLLGQQWYKTLQPQPTQKGFESLLLQKLQSFDPTKTVWLESESHKIGNIHLPSTLGAMMKKAICVELELPLDYRVDFLLHQYSHLISNPEILKTQLKELKYRYGQEKIKQWYTLIDEGKWSTLVKDLLINHYDPAYYRSLNKIYQNIEQKIFLSDLSDHSIQSVIKILS